MRALADRGRTAHAVELPSDPELRAAEYGELVREQVGALAAPTVLAHSAGLLLPAPQAPSARAARSGSLRGRRPDASFVEDVEAQAAAAFNPDWIGKDRVEDDAVATTFL